MDVGSHGCLAYGALPATPAHVATGGGNWCECVGSNGMHRRGGPYTAWSDLALPCHGALSGGGNLRYSEQVKTSFVGAPG